MLFSNKKIADYVNTHYEPTWKSLRPVPKVEVDFGNGTVVKRTLNGNIATFICTADGTVLDIVAGMNEPEVFLQRLRLAEALAAKLPADPVQRLAYLTAYHKAESHRELTGIYAADLRDDVRENGPRYRQIHSRLAQQPLTTPGKITVWLYKEVLHVDLNDPYLGLKPVLFASYPFKDEKD